MTDTAVTTTPEAHLLSAAEAAGLQLSAMLADLPEAGEDAYLDILSQITAATSVEQLDAPWELGSLEKFVGQRLEVRSLRRMPSDYADGLGFYLLIEAKVHDTGEIVTLSTGSTNVVTQLAKAYQLGALPLQVVPQLAKKPSKAGYWPMHLALVRG